MTVLTKQVLLLNTHWEPIGVIGVLRAIVLEMKRKVRVEQVDPTRFVHSVSKAYPVPSVVVQTTDYVNLRKKRQASKKHRFHIFVRDRFRCQYCISPKTKVLTSSLTWVSADSVLRGHELVGVDEEAPFWLQRKIRETLVTRVIKFVGPRLRVNTSQGCIIVSPDHKFLHRNANGSLKWREADTLVRGTTIKSIGPSWEDRSNTWLAGVLDGEGSLNLNKGSLNVSQNEGFVLERIEHELSALGVDYSKRLVDKNKSPMCHQVTITNRSDLFLLLGSLRPTRMSDPIQIGHLLGGKLALSSKYDAVVLSIEQLPDGPLVGITTSTGTFISDGYVSHNCGKKFHVFDLTLDHILPKSCQGSDEAENLATACRPCNHRKGNRTPDEARMPLLATPSALRYGLDRALLNHYAEDRPEWRPYLEPYLRVA